MSQTPPISLVEQFNQITKVYCEVAADKAGARGLLTVVLPHLHVIQTLEKIERGESVREQHGKQLMKHIRTMRNSFKQSQQWQAKFPDQPAAAFKNMNLGYANAIITAIETACQKGIEERKVLTGQGYSLTSIRQLNAPSSRAGRMTGRYR